MADVVWLIVGLALGFYGSEKGHNKMFTAMLRKTIALETENERLKQIIDRGFEWEG